MTRWLQKQHRRSAYSPFTAYLRIGNAVSFFACFSVFSDACAPASKLSDSHPNGIGFRV